MQKWEYKIVYHPSENTLNQLGNEGWELVTVAADTHGNADETSSTTIAYLKRQK